MDSILAAAKTSRVAHGKAKEMASTRCRTSSARFSNRDFSLLLLAAEASATSVVAVRTPTDIYVGAESKVKFVGLDGAGHIQRAEG